MRDSEPIPLRARAQRAEVSIGRMGEPTSRMGLMADNAVGGFAVTAFTRVELSAILAVYGRLMAEGECRDYALDFGRETAVFSIFRRTSEVPLYRIEKTPKLARKQGAFCVITPTGLILRRGHELARVLEVLAKKIRVVGR